jgi:ornithine cyclodeaminase
MKLLTFSHLQNLIRDIGMAEFLRQVIVELEADFRRWPQLRHSPRHAFHYPFGVMELMPCADDAFYAAKYVNGHPRNAAQGRLSIAALGLLADVPTGHPLMVSDMTLLTAVRTAATAALAARYLARPDSHHVALIGTGAQAEFEIMTLKAVLPVETVSYYDIDKRSMDKFARNMKGEVALQPCESIVQALQHADLWVTATAAKREAELVTTDMLRPGVHINALGGDCPGKTELQPGVLEHCKIVVEYTEQSLVEGEIQHGRAEQIHAELWQVINGDRPGRESADEMTLFDSVGVGMEDFSILKLVYRLARERGLGDEVALLPEPVDAKDLYSLVLRG